MFFVLKFFEKQLNEKETKSWRHDSYCVELELLELKNLSLNFPGTFNGKNKSKLLSITKNVLHNNILAITRMLFYRTCYNKELVG